ncbi:MAG: UDP-N-acetylglucosamine--N-acetylmuramyl-(pentapeptide) pyrophosphoryl-undecaprenol N-acetylglucosamine transferase [Acidimicrobiales bacterium]
MSRRYAVVAGGGTAGHALPALSVARALAERGADPGSIELVGSRRGPEGRLLGDQGFPLTLLPGRGFSRRRRPADLWANALAALGLGAALLHSLADLVRWRPRVVVSVGGYASFAPAAAAVALRVPLVLVNTDAVPGLVHRVLGRFAAAAAVAFPGTPLPRAEVTGTPVRREIRSVDRHDGARASAKRQLGVPPGRRLLGAFGGSLGARRINQAVAGLAERWSERDDLAIHHVVGRRDWDGDPGSEGTGALLYRRVAFEDRMDLVYQAADLVVCRAGAITVAELAVAGVPAVLVPLPGAPGDHQTRNADQLVAAGAAVLVPDAVCDADELAVVAGGLLDDPAHLAAMGRAARALGHPDAAEKVAEVVAANAR